MGMAISDDTILRVLKGSIVELPAPGVLQVVGLDDWAWQKGQHHYGTILVDLGAAARRGCLGGAHRRCRGGVARRPSLHPHQPRSAPPNAEGVRRGAPQATQVADRFHLVLNLRDAV